MQDWTQTNIIHGTSAPSSFTHHATPHTGCTCFDVLIIGIKT